MSTVGVHPRIHRRHSNVSDEDVMSAMQNMLGYTLRSSGEYLAVGVDSKSRLLELVYQYDSDDDFFFVYHAMTPPSGKTLKELRLERG